LGKLTSTSDVEVKKEREREKKTGLSIGRWAMEEGLRERNHHWMKGNGHCEL
jgi:hypothetical protein